jgi:hypothetical protein
VLRSGGDARQLQRRELVDRDLAFDRARVGGGVAIELHVGVAHHLGPVGELAGGLDGGGGEQLRHAAP